MVPETISNDFIKRWQKFYGEKQTRKITKSLYQSDPRIITPNKIKISLNRLKKLLEKRGFRFQMNSPFYSLITDYEPFNIVATPEYLAGLFSIQALTSIIPPISLNPSPGSFVVDLAASPGIKTCLLAQVMENTGNIIAFEKAKKRIPALKANISRMGISNTIILNCDSNFFPNFQIKADHIMLDAPCSGTGLKLIKNKRLEQRKLNDINRLSSAQQQLLDTAWNQLKVGGTLIYSTCSLEPEEGEVQIHEFLLKHPDQVELLPLKLDIGLPGNQTYWEESLNPMLRHSRRIFPELGHDGFFVTLMKKVSVGDNNTEEIRVKDIPSPSRNLEGKNQSRAQLLEKYNNKSKEVSISILSKDEVDNIARVVNQIIPINEFSQFCANYNFLKLHDRREDVYIIKKEDLLIFDEVIKFLMITPSKLAHLKRKLGFFLKNRFRIGIESLQTLARLYQNPPFIINDKQAEKFIYGKNVEIPIVDENNHFLTISDPSITIVFNKNQIPLGYAKIIKNEKRILLQNIIDIGLYLRSEKTAF